MWSSHAQLKVNSRSTSGQSASRNKPVRLKFQLTSVQVDDGDDGNNENSQVPETRRPSRKALQYRASFSGKSSSPLVSHDEKQPHLPRRQTFPSLPTKRRPCEQRIIFPFMHTDKKADNETISTDYEPLLKSEPVSALRRRTSPRTTATNSNETAVSFDAHVWVREYQPPQADPRQSWYTHQDLMRFKREAILQMRARRVLRARQQAHTSSRPIAIPAAVEASRKNRRTQHGGDRVAAALSDIYSSNSSAVRLQLQLA